MRPGEQIKTDLPDSGPSNWPEQFNQMVTSDIWPRWSTSKVDRVLRPLEKVDSVKRPSELNMMTSYFDIPRSRYIYMSWLKLSCDWAGMYLVFKQYGDTTQTYKTYNTHTHTQRQTHKQRVKTHTESDTQRQIHKHTLTQRVTPTNGHTGRHSYQTQNNTHKATHRQRFTERHKQKDSQ